MVTHCLISAKSVKRKPFRANLRWGNKNKSAGSKSEEWGGCGRTVTLRWARKLSIRIAVYGRELTWRKFHSPLWPNPPGALPVNELLHFALHVAMTRVPTYISLASTQRAPLLHFGDLHDVKLVYMSCNAYARECLVLTSASFRIWDHSPNFLDAPYTWRVRGKNVLCSIFHFLQESVLNS